MRLDSSSGYLRFVAPALLLVSVSVYYLYQPAHSIVVSKWRLHGLNKSVNVCNAGLGLDRVVITVKTGATEASIKVPAQLRTSLRCAPNVYVFSDMAQKLGTMQIYDALDTISPAVKDENPDFDIYRKQQELNDVEKIVKTLHNLTTSDDSGDLAAWVLDKYKNNHIVEKSWALKPNMDWYFHIDADTYVFLPSLASWLRRMDPSKEAIIGAIALIDNKEFAHGGSGILISNAATWNFVITHNGTAAKWDSEIRNNCCGDWVLAHILYEYGIRVTEATPTLHGEPLGSIPFGPDYWCQSVATLHHVSISEADRIGKFEQQRPDVNAPVSYYELFYGLVFETIPSETEANWDNYSEDETIADIISMEACIAACAKNTECLQLRFNGEECFLGTYAARLGVAHNPKNENEKRWQSSWNRTRIAEWASYQVPCQEVVFPLQT